MKPAPFAYHRAYDAATAIGLITDLGDEAKFIAGGQSLVAMMAFRLARPTDLVDITPVRGLDYVRREGETLMIGALTTHHRIEQATDAELGRGFRVLRNAMDWVGHLPIRTRGTVGGSLAHADATAEWVLLAVVLEATIVVEGPAGQRLIPAAEFFLGYYSTLLEYDELIVEIRFGHPAVQAAICEFAQRKGDFATVSAAVVLDLDGRDVRGGRVALGGVAPTPVRIPQAEALLAHGGRIGREFFGQVAAAAAAAIDPSAGAGDGSQDDRYRCALTRTLVAQACAEAAA